MVQQYRTLVALAAVPEIKIHDKLLQRPLAGKNLDFCHGDPWRVGEETGDLAGRESERCGDVGDVPGPDRVALFCDIEDLDSQEQQSWLAEQPCARCPRLGCRVALLRCCHH